MERYCCVPSEAFFLKCCAKHLTIFFAYVHYNIKLTKLLAWFYCLWQAEVIR